MPPASPSRRSRWVTYHPYDESRGSSLGLAEGPDGSAVTFPVPNAAGAGWCGWRSAVSSQAGKAAREKKLTKTNRRPLAREPGAPNDYESAALTT
jgi:hypothetical protein